MCVCVCVCVCGGGGGGVISIMIFVEAKYGSIKDGSYIIWCRGRFISIHSYCILQK